MSPRRQWIGTQVLRLRWPPWPQEKVLGNGSPYNPQLSCSPKGQKGGGFSREGKRREGKDGLQNLVLGHSSTQGCRVASPLPREVNLLQP